jgi:hypothetical protein
MDGRSSWGDRMTRLRDIAPLVAATALAVGAVVAARTAGCDDPGHYEVRSWGYELVGGCIAPGDLVVRDPVPAPKPVNPISPARD